jgi:hypothetical protein
MYSSVYRTYSGQNRRFDKDISAGYLRISCVRLLRSKIHRATVTHVDLYYVGSVSIDQHLLDAAGISHHEQVHILDITNGSRVITYAIPAPRGSGRICLSERRFSPSYPAG